MEMRTIDFNRAKFKTFTLEEAEEWGRKNYGEWLQKLQNQDYEPQTPVEELFRYYTQGTHKFFNNITRNYDINTYDFSESFFSREMFDSGIREINCHTITDDIVVYRYVSKALIKRMLEWGSSKSLKRNSFLLDKGFFSTTLSLEAVKGRDYANLKERDLFTIYVPKGSHGVYVDLISDMNEKEILFAPGIRLQVVGKHWSGKYIECIMC